MCTTSESNELRAVRFLVIIIFFPYGDPPRLRSAVIIFLSRTFVEIPRRHQLCAVQIRSSHTAVRVCSLYVRKHERIFRSFTRFGRESNRIRLNRRHSVINCASIADGSAFFFAKTNTKPKSFFFDENKSTKVLTIF